MEFRFEKTARALLTGLLLLAPAALAAQEFRYEVWHGHSRLPRMKKAGGLGELAISEKGVSFEERYKPGDKPKEPHSWAWKYEDIQQLKLAPRSLTVLTYQDNKWKLGADRSYEFDLQGENTLEDALRFLRTRLDQRLVSAIALPPSTVHWEIPVKRQLRFGGDEGVLQVGEGEIVFHSNAPDQSRTWRYEDIDNVSSSGPFELTITTFEQGRLDYGSLRAFRFQLKQRLDEDRYNDLWLRLNRSKGLTILNSYRQ